MAVLSLTWLDHIRARYFSGSLESTDGFYTISYSLAIDTDSGSQFSHLLNVGIKLDQS